ncbi:MAG: C25 family cysteine peptidase [Polyangia bacterium]
MIQRVALRTLFLSLVLLACDFAVAAPEDGDLRVCREDLTVRIGPIVRELTCRRDWAPREIPLVSILGDPRRPSPDPISTEEIDMPVFPRRLVVVTTNELVTESTMLQELVNWRRSCGFDVIVGTEWAWNRSTGKDLDDRAARIRAWLADIYAEHGGGYLLLIGAPTGASSGVPMRRVDPLGPALSNYPSWMIESMSDVPTDAYYADVESDWDCDGDGVFGEYPQDLGSGCCDWGPEFVTGRIPYYGDIEVLDGIIASTIAYEQSADKSYRDRALFAGAFGGFRGQPSPSGDGSTYHSDSDLAGFLHRTAEDIPGHLVDPVRLFEEDGIVVSSLPHERPLDADTLVDEWFGGASTVGWGGHGSSISTHRQVWDWDSNGNELAESSEVSAPAFVDMMVVEDLYSAPLAIVHMMSCLNGKSDAPGNLGFSLLGNGAVATASASRVAVGAGGEEWEPMPDLADATTNAYYFLRMVQAGHSAGEALAFTKWGLPGMSWSAYEESGEIGGDAYSWLTKFEYNLYGDPTVSLERCSVDSECEDGLPCNGSERCEAGYCVHVEPVICEQEDESNPCLTRACNNETGKCETIPTADGIPCEDGLYCTVDDACLAGGCLPGGIRDCPGPSGYLTYCDESADSCKVIAEEDIADSRSSSGSNAGCSSTAVGRRACGSIGLLLLAL